MWRPKTVLEIRETEQVLLKQDKQGRYECPNCGVLRHAAVIVDVRDLPIPEDWACDACWTKWERTGRIVDGGGSINGRFDWRRRWVIAHGAPMEIVEKFQSLARR